MASQPRTSSEWDRAGSGSRWVDPSPGAGSSRTGVVLRYTVDESLGGCRRGRVRTPWGVCCLAWSNDGILQWEFESEASGSRPWAGLRDGPLLREDILIDDTGAARWVARWSGTGREPSNPIPVAIRGTPFQMKVWQALSSVPRGRLTSYSRLAKAIGCPGAARAVGAACAANPVALVIPCHRVVRESGDLNGYRWGIERKARLLAWELGLPA